MVALSLEELTVIFNVKTLGSDGFVRYQREEVYPYVKGCIAFVIKHLWELVKGTDEHERAPPPEKPIPLTIWAEPIDAEEDNHEGAPGQVNGQPHVNGHI